MVANRARWRSAACHGWQLGWQALLAARWHRSTWRSLRAVIRTWIHRAPCNPRPPCIHIARAHHGDGGMDMSTSCHQGPPPAHPCLAGTPPASSRLAGATPDPLLRTFAPQVIFRRAEATPRGPCLPRATLPSPRPQSQRRRGFQPLEDAVLLLERLLACRSRAAPRCWGRPSARLRRARSGPRAPGRSRCRPSCLAHCRPLGRFPLPRAWCR